MVDDLELNSLPQSIQPEINEKSDELDCGMAGALMMEENQHYWMNQLKENNFLVYLFIVASLLVIDIVLYWVNSEKSQTSLYELFFNIFRNNV